MHKMFNEVLNYKTAKKSKYWKYELVSLWNSVSEFKLGDHQFLTESSDLLSWRYWWSFVIQVLTRAHMYGQQRTKLAVKTFKWKKCKPLLYWQVHRQYEAYLQFSNADMQSYFNTVILCHYTYTIHTARRWVGHRMWVVFIIFTAVLDTI